MGTPHIYDYLLLKSSRENGCNLNCGIITRLVNVMISKIRYYINRIMKDIKLNGSLQLLDLELKGIIKEGKVVLLTNVDAALSKYEPSIVKERKNRPTFQGTGTICMKDLGRTMPKLYTVLLQIYDNIGPQLKKGSISDREAAKKVANLLKEDGLAYVSSNEW